MAALADPALKTSSKCSLSFCIPGDPATLTGGYLYDKHMTHELRTLGWDVTIRGLDAGFPEPAPGALEAAAALFARLPDRELVLIDGLALPGLTDLVARERERLRIVGLVHHPTALETGLEATRAAALARAEGAALTRLRLVICTSAWTARTLAAAGVAPARLRVVPPGTRRAPHARGSRSATLNLLSVATVTPRKGHGILIDALAPLRAVPWHLHVVGSLARDARCAAALREQITARGLGDRVTLHGEIPGDALDRLYDAADVFVLASQLEGYGMAIAEALARGLAVVATSGGAIPELVTSGCGRLVAPGDAAALSSALAELLTHRAVRVDLAERARAVGRALPDWNAAARELADALVSIPRA